MRIIVVTAWVESNAATQQRTTEKTECRCGTLLQLFFSLRFSDLRNGRERTRFGPRKAPTQRSRWRLWRSVRRRRRLGDPPHTVLLLE